MQFKSGITDAKIDIYWSMVSALGGTSVGCLLATIMGIFLVMMGASFMTGTVFVVGQVAASVFGFLAGLGMDFRRGLCPYCGGRFRRKRGPGFDCPTCGNRIFVKEKKAYTETTFSSEHGL